MQRMAQRQHDRAARERDVARAGREGAEQDPRIEMTDRIRIVGAVQRHVAYPQRAKAERVGERGQLDLLVEVRDDVAAAQQRQRQADRQPFRGEDA